MSTVKAVDFSFYMVYDTHEEFLAKREGGKGAKASFPRKSKTWRTSHFCPYKRKISLKGLAFSGVNTERRRRDKILNQINFYGIII